MTDRNGAGTVILIRPVIGRKRLPGQRRRPASAVRSGRAAGVRAGQLLCDPPCAPQAGRSLLRRDCAGTAQGRLIELDVAGPSLLAHIVGPEFADHLPRYRQGIIHARGESTGTRPAEQARRAGVADPRFTI